MYLTCAYHMCMTHVRYFQNFIILCLIQHNISAAPSPILEPEGFLCPYHEKMRLMISAHLHVYPVRSVLQGLVQVVVGSVRFWHIANRTLYYFQSTFAVSAQVILFSEYLLSLLYIVATAFHVSFAMNCRDLPVLQTRFYLYLSD